jgi:hypothetical protein
MGNGSMGEKFLSSMNPTLGRSLTRNLNFNLVRASIKLQFTSIRTMATINPPRDPNTVSNYNNWRSTHITANFDILFDQKKLVGNVVHQFKSITDGESQEIILDTSHLDIGVVKVDGQPSKWKFLPPLEPYGVPLKICLDKPIKLNGTVEVDVCFFAILLHEALSHSKILDRGENHRQVHRVAVADACANLKQETSIHVYVIILSFFF